MARPLAALLMTIAALVAAGCGEDGAPDSPEGAANQVQQELSGQARLLLQRTESLASDVVAIGEQLAGGDIDQQEAASRLTDLRGQAETLATEAQALPENESAREQITALAERTRESADALLEQTQGEAPSADTVQEQLDPLREQARGTADELRDRLPQDAQQQLDDALQGLGG